MTTIAEWLREQEREAVRKRDAYPYRSPEGEWHRAQAAAFEASHAYAVARPDAAPTAKSGTERVRHGKRGTEYEVLGEAEVQCGGPPLDDSVIMEGDRVVVYRGDDGKLWVREVEEFRDGRFETITAPPPPAGAAGGGSGDLAALSAACKPWEFCAGDPPDHDSPLHQVFVAGMLYTEKLLAGFLDVEAYEPGDGSEDFDQDATKSLENILTAAGLYDPEEGRKATLAPTPELGAQGEPVAHKIIEAADCIGVRGADWALTIEWPDGVETVEHVSSHAARVLGYRPDDEDVEAPAAPRTGSGVSVDAVTDDDVDWLAHKAIDTGDRTLARIAAALKVGRS